MRECPVCFSCYYDSVAQCPFDGRPTFYSLPGNGVLEGKYVLEHRIGEGGMGVVYKAHHKFLKTTRAIKIIKPELVGNDPSFAARFYQEARAAAMINHPNIISVPDFGLIEKKIPYIVMEFVEGISLQDLMTNEGKFTPEKAFEYMHVIASAVGAAHAHGIVHRDLKPLNIMLTTKGTVREQIRILDFGLAKIISADLFGSSFIGAKTGGIIGSPYYMAPEQWSGEDIDKRCDVYSLGIILYQMLTGDVPFKGSSVPAIMKQHLMSPPPPLATEGTGITLQLERVVQHALEKQPALRTASTEDLIAELEQAIFGSPAAQVNKTRRRIKAKARVDGCKEDRPRLGPEQDPILMGQRSATEKVEAEMVASKPDQDSSTIVQGDLTLHMDKKELKKPKQLHHSSAVALRYSEAFRHSEEHIFEQLILHKDYERLWRSLIHAGGGSNLLTGYGPFGGTTLVRCAIEKARDELKKTVHRQAALLVFYFSVISENKDSFKLEATQFDLGHLNRSSTPRQDSGFNELKARAGQAADDQVSILNFPLANPLGETFFNPKTLTRIEKPKDNYDFSNLVDDLNAYFREQKNSRALRQIISSLVRSEFLPSRVVFIIDRIKHLETLETLAASDFFSNKRIRVIAVSRQEDLDTWSDADNRLETIRFAKWYVPCLWEIDFDRVLFEMSSGGLSVPKHGLRVFVKHLEFRGRGSFGNIMEELRQGRNINFGEHTNFIDLKYLAGRTDIRHNAWLQDCLDMNWDVLLSDHFIGVDQEEKQDRARIAIYYLLDWISRKGRFLKAEILEQANKTRITISDDAEIRTEATETLLYVLSDNRYLVKNGFQYRISWNKDKPPRCRRVSRKRPARLRDSHFAKLLTSLITSKKSYAPDNETNISVSSVLSPSKVTQHEVVNPETTLVTIPAPPPLVKTFQKTITEKTEYFIDKDELAAESIGMLVVFANPKGSDHLRLENEDRIIQECIRRSNKRAMFRVKTVHAARVKDFQRELLEADYQIVQFSGHGTTSGELAFEDEVGQIKPVPQKALSDLLKEFPSIECVILNACYSKNQGEMISWSVPFTIAMNKAISDDASQSFTRGFYDALGAGRDYRFAYKMGCKAILLEGYAEETTPILFEKQQ